MAAPPTTKKITSDDLNGDWQEDLKKLLPRLNSFMSDANTVFQGGTGLVSNLGCQLLSFQVNVPSAWTQLTLLNSWAPISGIFKCQYRKDPLGVVWVQGRVSGGSSASAQIAVLPSGFWPGQEILTSERGNGAYASLSVGPAGVIQGIESNVTDMSINCSYPCADLSPGVPSCWPKSFKCTLPQGKARSVQIGSVVDVTTGSNPVGFTPLGVSWSNSNGRISINNIPGLLPSRAYSINLIAYPMST